MIILLMVGLCRCCFFAVEQPRSSIMQDFILFKGFRRSIWNLLKIKWQKINLSGTWSAVVQDRSHWKKDIILSQDFSTRCCDPTSRTIIFEVGQKLNCWVTWAAMGAIRPNPRSYSAWRLGLNCMRIWCRVHKCCYLNCLGFCSLLTQSNSSFVQSIID